MIADSIWQLLQTLLSKTDGGSVAWKEARQAAYAWTGPHGTVIISSRDDDGAAPFVVTIQDREGNVVESVESHGDNTPGEFDSLLENLYETARRNALNIDPLVRSMISDLSLDDLPF